MHSNSCPITVTGYNSANPPFDELKNERLNREGAKSAKGTWTTKSLDHEKRERTPRRKLAGLAAGTK